MMTAARFCGAIKIRLLSVICWKNVGQNMKRRQTSPWQRIIEESMISAMRLFERLMKIRRQKNALLFKGEAHFWRILPCKIFFFDDIYRHFSACPESEGGSPLIEEHVKAVESLAALFAGETEQFGFFRVIDDIGNN